MSREATQPDPRAPHRYYDALLREYNVGRPDDMVQIFDVLSEKLRLLRSQDMPAQETEKAPDETAEEMVECAFKETCYAAKSKTGSCPCELQSKP